MTAIPTVPTRKPFYYLTASTKTKLASGNTPIKHTHYRITPSSLVKHPLRMVLFSEEHRALDKLPPPRPTVELEKLRPREHSFDLNARRLALLGSLILSVSPPPRERQEYHASQTVAGLARPSRAKREGGRQQAWWYAQTLAAPPSPGELKGAKSPPAPSGKKRMPKSTQWGLLVSALLCKGHKSHHSVLTRKELKKLQINFSFIGEPRSQSKRPVKTRARQTQRNRAYWGLGQRRWSS